MTTLAEIERDKYAKEASRLREAIEYVVTKFEQDEAQGYRTKDREFAITILRKALSQ